MNREWLPVIAVATPLIAALLTSITRERLAELWSYPAAAITLLATALMLPDVLAGEAVTARLFALIPGVELALRADALGMTFALLAGGLWVVASVYSSGYVRADHLKHRTRYFACFAASIGAAIGVATSANLLTFLLFYELLTLSTYPLVVHKETPEAIAGGRRYLIFALSGGLMLTIAIVWTWFLAGSLDFVAGGFLQDHATPGQIAVLFALFMVGCGVKAAIMPLHSWLPAAMVAPSPVSALLHAVAVVKAGVFGCIRIFAFVFGHASIGDTAAPQIVSAVCLATIVIGSLLALQEDSLKRRLAYSTVVHLSYIVFGAAMLAPHALTGAVLHMVNHGLAKITLFFCAGAIYCATHFERISRMKGLARRMPWTFAAFTIASFGLIGVPGLCGFVGKLFLCRGALDAGAVWQMLILISASILSAAYLLPILKAAWFETPDPAHEQGHDYDPGHAHDPSHRHEPPGEARLTLVVPLMVTAGFVIIFGMVPGVIAIQYRLADRVSAEVFASSGPHRTAEVPTGLATAIPLMTQRGPGMAEALPSMADFEPILRHAEGDGQ